MVSSQSQIYPEMFQDTRASSQREMRLLGEMQKANLFELGVEGALEGLLILLLLIKHLPPVLAIVVTGAEKHCSGRGFLTDSGLNRFLRNFSALDLKHSWPAPKMPAASWCQSNAYQCHELNQSPAILHGSAVPNSPFQKVGDQQVAIPPSIMVEAVWGPPRA